MTTDPPTPSALADELMSLVADYRSGFLQNRSSEDMCYILCLPLSGYLQAIGHDNELVEGTVVVGDMEHNHFWIKIGNTIIDPTADQFHTPEGERMPNVYIGPKPDWYLIDSSPENVSPSDHADLLSILP